MDPVHLQGARRGLSAEGWNRVMGGNTILLLLLLMMLLLLLLLLMVIQMAAVLVVLFIAPPPGDGTGDMDLSDNDLSPTA